MLGEIFLYLFCALVVMFFAYMWFMLGANHYEKDIKSDIDAGELYIEGQIEEIERLKKVLESLKADNSMLDEELNGYQSGRDKYHA